MSNKKPQQSFQYNTVPTSDNTQNTLFLEKGRLIVPIIFIPGVMGSNLKVKPKNIKKQKAKKVWRLDSHLSVLGWALPYYGNAKARKLELAPDKTAVDDRGKIIEASDDASDRKVAQIKHHYDTQLHLLGNDKSRQNEVRQLKRERRQKIDEAIKNTTENRLFGSRQERGWGTVGFFSYGEFLDELQTSLFDQSGSIPAKINELVNKSPLFSLDDGAKTTLFFKDKKDIEHCKQFYFPVHAMGYNWLKSNEDSAMALKELVDVTLPRYYQKRGKFYGKVIIITHSMGGLVSRCYTQALGGEDKVLGVIHGVQPATGAVAAYTRMKRGTEVNSGFFGKPVAAITENVLGKDAAEMTAVCAQAPGPLQLLPTPEYGMEWLNIIDANGNPISYFSPENPDIYNDIYLAKDKWWCVCEPHLINPLNSDHNEEQMKVDWYKYESIMIKKVKTFNSAIANQYHPNTYAFFGIENEEEQIKMSALTYQTAQWQGKNISSHKEPATNHIGDQRRLNLKELKGSRTLKNGDISEKYTLLPADGNGDGTVPQRSGEIPIKYLTARMHFSVEHEPAYQKDESQDFTLRAIIDIVKKVPLA
ncbi:hypothetical protein FcAc13_11945 [Frischella sp. Ac13]|uniref:PGAP1-like protein n=1 Tax=Frischella japonica TaxID=2741544 RepID=A0ABR7R0P1_9GAMM|nr:hypothetical protein [Frischella japonica]MBC9132012.1 hypothetical protein [Frischella japonica]